MPNKWTYDRMALDYMGSINVGKQRHTSDTCVKCLVYNMTCPKCQVVSKWAALKCQIYYLIRHQIIYMKQFLA